MITNKKILYEKAKFYLEKKSKIHISTVFGSGRTFYNGEIKTLDESKIILIDVKFGECFISFEEISDILPYKEEEKQ